MGGQKRTTKKAQRAPYTSVDWADAFLSALRKSGNISKACRLSSVARSAAYERRKVDESFAAQWDDALDESADVLEAEAWRRAVEGLERKKFDKGNPIIDPATKKHYIEREYSDTLLIFLLKGARPAKYRERGSLELAGKVQIDDTGLTDDERATRIATILDAARARRDRSLAEHNSG